MALPLIPLAAPSILRLGVVALVAASICAVSYVKGRKDVREAWDLERAQNAVAAAKQEAAAKERERQWTEYSKQAEVMYGKKMLVTGERARTELERLRDAAATARLVSDATAPAGSCPERPRCATAAELHGLGKELVRVASAADTERAGLMACAQAWPQ